MTFPTFLMHGLIRPLKSLPALFAVMALSACSSLRQADSPLPLEVRHTGSGQVISIHAYETSDRLHVAGRARKHRLSNTAQVDIQLIGFSGEIIAEDRNVINPVHPAHGGGKRFTDSYGVSFPLSATRQAAKIRVIYHSGTHS